jgi:hypothetical protein
MQFPDGKKKSDKTYNKESWLHNLTFDDWKYLSIPIVVISAMIAIIVMDLRPHFWVKTTGQVTKTWTTREDRRSGRYTSRYFVANVEYTFTAKGKEYTSTMTTGGLWNCNYADTSEYNTVVYLCSYKPGTKIDVFYKKSFPESCCRERTWSTTAQWCIFILCIICYEILHQKWPKIFWRPPLSK